MHNLYAKYQQIMHQGAREAEVYAQEGESFVVGVRDGAVETYESTASFELCLRVQDACMGYASTEDKNYEPQKLYDYALHNAKSVESKDEQPLYAGGSLSSDTLNEELLKSTASDKVNTAFTLERLALDAHPLITRVQGCHVITGFGRTDIFNTLGLNATKRTGHALAYVLPVAKKDGEEKNGFAAVAARSLDELDLESLIARATQKAIKQLGARSIPTGRYDVLIENEATIELFGAFLSLFSSEAAQKGLSLFSGKEGQVVAGKNITIVDSPAHPFTLLNTAFDSEGVPAQHTILIQNGELRTLLYNLKTAKKAGIPSTGNAGKAGVSSPIGIRPHNCYIQPGECSIDELLKTFNGLLITGFNGLHAGTNAVSGDFSLSCHGFRVQNGDSFPVHQITLSGNFLSLLLHVDAVGSDLYFAPPVESCIGAPSLLLRDMVISGSG